MAVGWITIPAFWFLGRTAEAWATHTDGRDYFLRSLAGVNTSNNPLMNTSGISFSLFSTSYLSGNTFYLLLALESLKPAQLGFYVIQPNTT